MSDPTSIHHAEKDDLDCLPDDVWPIGKRAAFYSCFVVFLLGTFDFIDRQVLAALLPYIKAEWLLSDTQLGLLVSIVNIVMSILVIPSAYLIDRWSRKKMIAIMGTIWSLATGACAFAGSYTHLLVARAFIGSGEAGYNPAAQALLAAQFPRKHRGTAIALTQVGLGLGAPLGLLIGAWAASHWGWRHAFGIVAVPGLILALMSLLIKDYKSVDVTVKRTVKRNDAETTEAAGRMSYPAVLASIISTPSLLCVFFGAVMTMMHSGANMNWLPSYLQRQGGLSVSAASGMAAAVLFASLISAMITGPIMDLLRKYARRGVPLFVAVSLFCAATLSFAAYSLLTPGSGLQLVTLIAAQLCMGVAGASGPIIVMDLAHPGARATAAGLLIFSQNLFGFAMGPLITGFLSDHFDLGTALLLMASITPFLVALSYGICAFTYGRDLDKAGCVNLEFNAN